MRNMTFSLKTYFFILCCIPFVTSFSWKNCGDATDPIKVLSLDISTDKTETLYVTGRGKLAMNLTAPIQGQVIMQKKFFWDWLKIPCVDQIGSCTYNDVCSMSPYIDKSCPSEFKVNELPCKCPVLQGQYAAKKFPVDLSKLPKWIEKGKYRFQLTLIKDEKKLMCLLIYIDL